MKAVSYKYIYGPVPSRRLGRSLGIDMVPFKTCTYDCVYCQLGRTTAKTVERKEYVSVDAILSELEEKLATGETPDYISLAGSGEPTLNACIGELIERIKSLTDVPLAVLTNGSLLWVKEVQDALMAADLVLPSLDAGDEHLFQYVNRPHEEISFENMIKGLAEFTKRFSGEVWLEVLLLGGVTGIPSEVKKIASLIERIGPARVQLNTVSRPPAEEYALTIPPEQMIALKALIPGEVDIISEKGDGEPHITAPHAEDEENILALLNRRPCTAEDIAKSLGIHITEVIKHLEGLSASGRVTTTSVNKRVFYVPTSK